jgi:hypothetical protein
VAESGAFPTAIGIVNSFTLHEWRVETGTSAGREREMAAPLTMVKDATADYSDEEMHAALDVNIPNYANAIVTTNESSTPSLLSNLRNECVVLIPSLACFQEGCAPSPKEY